jgi:hypothetical protein
MQITFNSLDELKEFYNTFSPRSSVAVAATVPQAPVQAVPAISAPEESEDQGRRRGRKPAQAQPTTRATRSRKPAAAAAPAVRGRKASAPAMVEEEPEVEEEAPVATAAKRQRGEVTLTSRIQDVIREFISQRREFTASDVYEALAKQDDSINKQSVITSVLKQMNTTFNEVSVEERPGAGPRPVKVYMPGK